MDDPGTATRELHDRHAVPLLAFCLKLTNNDLARAEDVAQETMLRAWRNIGLLTESRGSVRSWLFTVARNIAIDEWRTRRAQLEVVTAELPEGAPVLDRVGQALDAMVIAECLESLSPDHRAVVVECYYNDRSVKQAAQRLGIPEGTVKSRAHYALRALRLALEERGVEL